MNTQQDLNVVFTNQSTNQLPVYRLMAGQSGPQEAYISLDLRRGEIDVDFDGCGSNTPISVWNDVEIRFLIKPELTGKSIMELIEFAKEDLQSFYNESTVEMDGSDFVGVPADEDADKEVWKEKICSLRDTIYYRSECLAVHVADDDTFNETITLTPILSDLNEYAASVLESVKQISFVDCEMDDTDVVSQLIIEMYIHNTNCLNKNSMKMLLTNIDDYASQTGYDLSDIDEDDIESAMNRA